MDMDMEELMQKYYNVTKKELEKIQETVHHLGMRGTVSESKMRILHETRENEKTNGKQGVLAGPLVHVLSVQVLPDKLDHKEPLSIYGKIYTEFCDATSGKTIVHDLYNIKYEDGQVLKPSGSLTLTNPEGLSWPLDCMPLHNTRIVVDLCVGVKSFGATYVCFDEDMTDFERVKQEHLRTDFGNLALRYIAIPFAIYGQVEVQFWLKQGCKLDGKRDFLHVKGRILARYGNPYGGCDLEECTLFEKQQFNEFQQVGFDLERTTLKLSRCWVALPAYSSLVVDLDLSEFGTERKIVKEAVEFRVQSQRMSYANFIVDDILVNVGVRWVEPTPQGRPCEKEYDMEPGNEFCDEKMSLQETNQDDSDDRQVNQSCVLETLSSNLKRPWHLVVHQSRPFPCSSVEIFSIFIGREKFKALQVYGCVEVSSLAGTFYCFNREEENAFGLLEGGKLIPVLNGSLSYDDCDSLKMKIDLKDAESRLHIKGYVDWDVRTLEYGTSWLNKQLCSVVEGEHGFAAIHYSIFPEAVQANVGVFCTPKSKVSHGAHGHDVLLKVYGSIIAQYKNYDYTSLYNKEYYRLILFQRSKEDPTQTSDNGAILLSRSMASVPLNSALVIEVNLRIGDDQVLWWSTTEFQIGKTDMKMENNKYCIHICVKWVEVND